MTDHIDSRILNRLDGPALRAVHKLAFALQAALPEDGDEEDHGEVLGEVFDQVVAVIEPALRRAVADHACDEDIHLAAAEVASALLSRAYRRAVANMARVEVPS